MSNDIFSDMLNANIISPKAGINLSNVCSPLAWRGSELESIILDSSFSSPSHTSSDSSDASEVTLDNDSDIPPFASPAGADADQLITSEMRFIDVLFDSSAFHDMSTTSSSSAIPESINQSNSQLPCASPNSPPPLEYSLFGAPIDASLLQAPSHILSPMDPISANTLQSASNGLDLFPLYGSDLLQYHSPASIIDPGHLSFDSLSNASDLAAKVLSWRPSLQINLSSTPVVSSIEWPVLETTPVAQSQAPVHASSTFLEPTMTPFGNDPMLSQGYTETMSLGFMNTVLDPTAHQRVQGSIYDGHRLQVPAVGLVEHSNNSKKRVYTEESCSPRKTQRTVSSQGTGLHLHQLQSSSPVQHYSRVQQHSKNFRSGCKPSSTKKVTDCAHYRPRNAFFMFRGFVSRLQCPIQHPPPLPPRTIIYSSSTSAALYPSPLPTRVPGQAQTKVSVSCGKIWSSECFDSCGVGGCANCRMRSLFGQASNYLKLRQTEIERRIEFPTSPSVISSNDDRNDSNHNNNNEQRNEMSHGSLTDMPLEDSFNWKEFEQLYYESDLFKWHRNNYLGVDQVLDIEDMKRIWIENEILYEKAFVETARRRIAQEGSRNAKKKKKA